MHIYARTKLALPGSSHLRQLLSLCRLDLHILGFPHAAAFLTSICNAERCSLPCFQLHIEPPNCPAPPFPTLVLCAEPKVPGVTFPRHSPFGLRCLVEFGDFEPHRCTGVTWVDRQGRTGSALVFLPSELPGRKSSPFSPPAAISFHVAHRPSAYSIMILVFRRFTRGREGIHTVSFDHKKKVMCASALLGSLLRQRCCTTCRSG